jgi:hypothetical protein
MAQCMGGGRGVPRARNLFSLSLSLSRLSLASLSRLSLSLSISRISGRSGSRSLLTGQLQGLLEIKDTHCPRTLR